MSDAGVLEVHELTRRAFLEGNAELVEPFIGESEIALTAGRMREETRGAWRERFRDVLASTTFERWDDIAPPRHGVSADGTMAWLVELVEMAGTRDGQPFSARIARLTVFEKRDGRWRRIANASSEAT